MKTAASVLTAAILTALTGPPAQAQVSTECSGIGEEERAMAEQIPHTLRLVYAQPDGDYLGNVETRITGDGGELVNVTCPGPWVLANLPTGSYQVSATFRGETKSRQVTVSGGRRQEQVITF